MTTTPLLDCGHVPSPHDACTTGTAHTPDGKEICWDCSYAAERAAMRSAPDYVAYVSGDGKTLTTWPGQTLARITASWPIWNNMAGKMLFFRAVDLDGKSWYGRSVGRGMYARLHRAKGAK